MQILREFDKDNRLSSNASQKQADAQMSPESFSKLDELTHTRDFLSTNQDVRNVWDSSTRSVLT